MRAVQRRAAMTRRVDEEATVHDGARADRETNKPDGTRLLLQAKLTVGPAGDRYEQEADQVAAQVMRVLRARSDSADGEETASPGGGAHTIRLRAMPGTSGRIGAEGGPIDDRTEAAIRHPSGGEPLPRALRHKVEGAFGADFSSVRVHTGQQVDGLARSLSAQAFTTGSNIFFAGGAYRPGTSEGDELLAHELAHTVQQGGVRRAVVQPKRSSKFRAMSGYEKSAADELGQTIPDKEAAAAIYKANQRLLNDAEISAFMGLSQTEEGKTWLKKKGFWDWDRVEAYAKAGSFKDWQGIPAQVKLQVATVQWNDHIDNTPGYWKGLSVNGQKGPIYAQDAAMWEKTLEIPTIKSLSDQNVAGPEAAKQVGKMVEATKILERIFVLLQAGLRYTDQNDDWANLDASKKPVAAALSHGGRVNVRIPALQPGSEDEKHDFIDWLLGDKASRKQAEVTTRASSTHNVKIGKNTAGPGTGSFEEIGSSSGYFRGITHFGINLPVGGLGKKDLNGDVILPDGRYGHLYIGYVPPTTKRDGALLIGLENDAHGAPGPNPLGHEHTISAKQGEFTPTGGMKEDKLGGTMGGRKVDITKMGNNWMTELQRLEMDVRAGRITSAELLGKQQAAMKLIP